MEARFLFLGDVEAARADRRKGLRLWAAALEGGEDDNDNDDDGERLEYSWPCRLAPECRNMAGLVDTTNSSCPPAAYRICI